MDDRNILILVDALKYLKKLSRYTPNFKTRMFRRGNPNSIYCRAHNAIQALVHSDIALSRDEYRLLVEVMSMVWLLQRIWCSEDYYKIVISIQKYSEMAYNRLVKGGCG